jgi:diguanylate cyclase (GGDEF)-like protein
MQLVSIAFLGGGVIYIVTKAKLGLDGVLNKNMLFAFVFWLFAFIIWMIQKKVKTYRLKTLAYSFVLSFSVPIITLKYIYNGAITTWAFPMLIIIAALLFRNTVTIIMVAYSTMLTQYYLWIFLPNQSVKISVTDYIGRTWILALAILLVCYINNIYLMRLKQLYEKIKVQDFLFLLLSDANKLDYQNCDSNMPDILSSLRNYLNADRICLTYGSKEEEQICYARGENENELTKKLINGEWWKIQGSVNGVVKIDDYRNLPDFAKVEKNILESQGIKSLLAVPIIGNGERTGWLKVASICSYRTWNEEEIKILVSVANILGDAKRRIHHEIKMEQMTFYDQLTCIPNRQLFGQNIDEKISITEKRDEKFCILLLDIDSFKNINDTMGHQFGDKILIAVSEKLSACLRRTDVICRFGGDEFLIMVNDITEQNDIESTVDKILKIFETPFVIKGKEFKITASIGISIYPMDGRDKETLIKHADIAMYKAKERGRNQYVFCTQEMKAETSQVAIITNELRNAMDNQEFNLVYQPQVEVKTGKVIATEALIRWNSRVLGNVSPAVFIPIAEQNGLITQIGEWVLWEACRQSKRLERMGIPTIRFAVNISVIQLQSDNFVRKVNEIIEETGINPAKLELEITESVASQDTELIKEKLLELKQLGVLLAIDDFGMEYSSLSRINSLPMDRLKLDMFFVKGILTSEKDRVILDAIIKMAKSLNLRVIAEGVEEEQQYLFLKERDCDEIQGYLFFRPMNAKKLESVLIEQNKDEISLV